ncbi:MAG: hypothetical protein HY717_09205 [Planctomycetes bacterium]|nr:hypothetical protein [Planctomycetota bacterium]
MAIEGSTPRKCFERFREHIGALVSHTLPTSCPIRFKHATEICDLSFDNNGPTTIPLETKKFGRLYFYLWHRLEAVKQGKKFILKTRQYKYSVQETSEIGANALIRWEYDPDLSKRNPPTCRNHVQMKSEIRLSKKGMFDLNRLHIASGWVLIEDVICFLIAELGVRPPKRSRKNHIWHKKLVDSAKLFKEKFSR